MLLENQKQQGNDPFAGLSHQEITAIVKRRVALEYLEKFPEATKEDLDEFLAHCFSPPELWTTSRNGIAFRRK